MRMFDRALAHLLRFAEATEHQACTPQLVVFAKADDSPRRVTLGHCSPSRSRFSASLVSPICASTHAERATASGSWTTTVPFRITETACSISSRALAQSPLLR